MSRIAKRYGRALFNIAKGDLGKAKRQLAALNTVAELFQQKDAGKVLVSPVMPADLKKAILDYGLDKAGADDDVRHLLGAVADAGRVAQIPDIAKSISELIDEAEGVARAVVTSAVTLGDAELKEIGAALGKTLKKNVSVKAHVDPALLGGFVAHVGNYRVDMS